MFFVFVFCFFVLIELVISIESSLYPVILTSCAVCRCDSSRNVYPRESDLKMVDIWSELDA